jgi:hypothetical protein
MAREARQLNQGSSFFSSRPVCLLGRAALTATLVLRSLPGRTRALRTRRVPLRRGLWADLQGLEWW